MTLMKTLTKVAIGIAVAKGVQTIAASRSSTTTSVGPADSGGTLRRAGTGRAYSAEDLGGIMDEILGSGRSTPRTARQEDAQPASRTGSSGLDDLFGTSRSTSRDRKAAPTGGLEDLLSGRSGGGLGDLLGAVLGGTTAAREMNGRATDTGRRFDEEQESEAEAAVLLRCMISAIKADRKMNATEKQRLMQAVDDPSRAEVDFINRELSAPLDLDSLMNDIPRGMEEKAYSVSLMAIDLDQREEAEYLHQLASGLGLDPREVNAIHDRMGAPGSTTDGRVARPQAPR